MSPLAFDKQGRPFSWHRRTSKLLVRVFRNPSARGTCAQVLDSEGQPLYVDAETDFLTFRRAVGHVPGLYRLDQCDDDGTEIDDAQPAYVSIDMARNASNASGGDGGDVNPLVIMEHMFAIHADVMKTMATQQASIMAASAELLRAPLRPALPAAAAPAESDARDEADDDEADVELEIEPDPWAAWRPLLQMAEPHLPKLGAFLYEQLVAYVKTTATPPAAAPLATPAPAPAAASAAPSSGPEPMSAAAGPSAPAAPPTAPAAASPVSAPVGAATDAEHVAGSARPDDRGPSADPTLPASPASASASAVSTENADADSEATAPVERVVVENPPAVALVPASPSAATPLPQAPRNSAAPTPAQWQHLYAIREQLTPPERASAEHLITLVSPEVLAQLLAELSALSVDDAVRALRTTMRRLAVMKTR